MKRLGVALIEILIAFGVTSVALVALIQSANKSVNNSGFSKRQSTATAYANQAIELVRSQKDGAGWDSFASGYPTGSYCFNGNTISSGSSCAIGSSEFLGRVDLTYAVISNRQTLEVTALIEWAEGGRTARANQSVMLTRY